MYDDRRQMMDEYNQSVYSEEDSKYEQESQDMYDHRQVLDGINQRMYPENEQGRNDPSRSLDNYNQALYGDKDNIDVVNQSLYGGSSIRSGLTSESDPSGK